MSRNCSIDELADVINEGLKEYARFPPPRKKPPLANTPRNFAWRDRSVPPAGIGRTRKR